MSLRPNPSVSSVWKGRPHRTAHLVGNQGSCFMGTPPGTWQHVKMGALATGGLKVFRNCG